MTNLFLLHLRLNRSGQRVAIDTNDYILQYFTAKVAAATYWQSAGALYTAANADDVEAHGAGAHVALSES